MVADILTVNGSLRLLSREVVVVLKVLNLVIGFSKAISAAIFSPDNFRAGNCGSLKEVKLREMRGGGEIYEFR